METHYLRTLSDSGDVFPAVQPPHIDQDDSLSHSPAAVPDAFVVSPVAGVVSDQPRVSSPDSESSKAESGYEDAPVGDEDEGFDEEFCEPEDVTHPMRAAPETTTSQLSLPLLNLQELNSDEIQSFLVNDSFPDGDDLAPPTFPAPSLLEDIDPGVYMTDMDPSTQSFFNEERKSPVQSPFPLSSPLNTMSLGVVGGESPVGEWSVSSGVAPYPATAYSDSSSSVAGDSEYSTDLVSSAQYMFQVPSLPSPSPTPPTTFNLDRLSTLPSSASSPLPGIYHHHHQTPPSSFALSSSSNMNLVNCYDGGSSPMHSPSPTPSPHHTSPRHTSPCHSPAPYQPHQSTSYEANSLINGQYNNPMHSPAQMLTTPTNNFSSCSTQTPLARTPSPTPSSTSHAQNTDDEPKRKPNGTNDGLINMPYYKFKKILDSPTVTEEEKSDIKNVRRRGKNKIAAKNCRQRKQELVLVLQQEIERLKLERDRVFLTTGVLEKEIAQLKTHCLAVFQRNKQQQQAVH